MPVPSRDFVKQSYYFLFSVVGLALLFMGGVILLKNLFGIQPFHQQYPEYYYPSNFEDLVTGYPSKGDVPVAVDPTIGRKKRLTMDDADALIAEFDTNRATALEEAALNLKNEHNDQFSMGITMFVVGTFLYLLHWRKVQKDFLHA